MPTKKSDTEYELSAVDCCALRMAIHKSGLTVKMMPGYIQRHANAISRKCCKDLDRTLAGEDATDLFVLDTDSNEGAVCRAYIECEIDRLGKIFDRTREIGLVCGHSVALHVGALRAVWDRFPKEKAQ